MGEFHCYAGLKGVIESRLYEYVVSESARLISIILLHGIYLPILLCDVLNSITHAMSDSPPPPSPTHILRSHSSPISALYISDNNNRIYSGDATGTITVTSTRTLRPIAKWKAHKESILGVEEWDSVIITSVWRDSFGLCACSITKQPRER